MSGLRMKLRDKLVQRAQPLLPEGAKVRHWFLCQTGPRPWIPLSTAATFFLVKFRAVCVTDDAIYVLRCHKLAHWVPRELVATLARDQQFGPVSGVWGKVQLLGERHWVHKGFYEDLEAADSSLPGL